MARTGTLIVLTVKLSHPNTRPSISSCDYGIARCLVNKKIPYLCYIFMYQHAITLDWCDVRCPSLRVNYTSVASSIYFFFKNIRVVFNYNVLEYNYIQIVTPDSNISMHSGFTPYVSCPKSNGSTSYQINEFRNELMILDSSDLRHNKYKLAEAIHQLVIQYNL